MPPSIFRRLTRRATFVLACAALIACGGGSALTPQGVQRPAGNADLANPPEVTSDGGVARLTLTAAIDPSTGGPGLRYNGAFAAPTIRVAPGDTIDVTYVNDLPSSTKEPLDMANLHFHGLTVSPNAPGDDAITTTAMPGQTLHYRVRIPATQPPGLYWYHSHAHGESNWQTFNGMSGAIVLNGVASFEPQTGGLPERIVVLRNALAHPSYAATLPHARRPSAACARTFGIPGEYTTVNGEPVPVNIAMTPERRQFWRVANASADGYYDLSIDGATLVLVSTDGVPNTAYPGGIEQRVHHVVVPPAGRIEFIVDGARAGAAFRTACFYAGPLGGANPAQVLGTMTNAAPAVPFVPAPGPTPASYGTYEKPIGTAYAQQRTVFFSENPAGTVFYLNGKSYHPNDKPMFVARAGTVERWTLYNFTQEAHAFHIHQVHFIQQDVNGKKQPQVWWDTINLPAALPRGKPSIVHVLVDFRDPIVRGTFLFHCHILQHEDLGMMAKIAVR
ncbi:MAG: multicopper oxidase family protein [Candidatus Eremiobacteraeota bacterium]|nr:multicopper oxidase family protein [Candidatus Eremiobacteraeota bacterium]